MRKVQICIPFFNFDFWALIRYRKKSTLYEYLFKMLSPMNIPCRLDNFILPLSSHIWKLTKIDGQRAMTSCNSSTMQHIPKNVEISNFGERRIYIEKKVGILNDEY